MAAGHLQDFNGKVGQLHAKPNTTALLFSYGIGPASGQLSIRTAKWKPKPNHTVVVAATLRADFISVTMSLDAQYRIMATIVWGGKRIQETSGVHKFGTTTVAIVPSKWTATVTTPTLTVIAQQVQCTSMLHSLTIASMRCRLLKHTLLLTPFQSGYKGNPKLAAGILVCRFLPRISYAHCGHVCTDTWCTPRHFTPQNVDVSALPTLPSPYKGIFAASYMSAAAKAHAAGNTARSKLSAKVIEV